jgi:hypothetical protein
MVGSRGYTVIANVEDPAAAYPEVSKRSAEEPTVRSIHLMDQNSGVPMQENIEGELTLIWVSSAEDWADCENLQGHSGQVFITDVTNHRRRSCLFPRLSYTPSITRDLRVWKACKYVETKIGAMIACCVSRAEKVFARVRCDVKAVSWVASIVVWKWYRGIGHTFVTMWGGLRYGWMWLLGVLSEKGWGKKRKGSAKAVTFASSNGLATPLPLNPAFRTNCV